MCKRNCRVIGRKYWWETLRDDVSAFIIYLMPVQKWKTGRRSVAPLGDILVAQEFLVITSLEVVGPLPVTKKGNKYLLTYIELFTRFCEAILIAMQNTKTIAREFVIKIITQFGVPLMLLTDRGESFTSAMITDIQID